MGSPWEVWLSLVIWVWMEGSLVGEAEKVIEFYKMCRKGVERRREGSQRMATGQIAPPQPACNS